VRDNERTDMSAIVGGRAILGELLAMTAARAL
jgi:hypothetical protein